MVSIFAFNFNLRHYNLDLPPDTGREVGALFDFLVPKSMHGKPKSAAAALSKAATEHGMEGAGGDAAAGQGGY